VRAWKEPQNHRTNDPPIPPEGGESAGVDRHRAGVPHGSRSQAKSRRPGRPRRGSPRPRSAGG
jgi:hypothetical protein